MTGVVTSIKRKARFVDESRGAGFGFIRDETGQDRFFHARDLAGGSGLFGVTIVEGTRVSFTPAPGTKANGLRAINVVVAPWYQREEGEDA